MSSVYLLFQFTRPQGARHSVLVVSFLWRVSIHAPARGATLSTASLYSASMVSIHAPARGATVAVVGIGQGGRFQFTRPQGARPNHPSPSTHQPSFNSRARKGRDSIAASRSASSAFQFTRPQGARRERRGVHHREAGVSIHAPARGATTASPACPLPREFQFTRPQGARLRRGPQEARAKQFQFTRPQGARQ